MAKRKKIASTAVGAKPADSVESKPASSEPDDERKAKAISKRKPGRGRRKVAVAKRQPRAETTPHARRSAASKARQRKRYTPGERRHILAAAKREGLSGPAAAKKFGISQLTFYTWRKKAGTKSADRRPKQGRRRA